MRRLHAEGIAPYMGRKVLEIMGITRVLQEADAGGDQLAVIPDFNLEVIEEPVCQLDAIAQQLSHTAFGELNALGNRFHHSHLRSH